MLRRIDIAEIMLALAAVCVVLDCAFSARGEDDPTVPFQPIRASVLYVHDADTINVDIHLPFKIDLPNRTIRAFGYDAWEVTKTRQTVKVTDAEIKKGLKARDELMALLKTGTLHVEDMTAIQIGWPQLERMNIHADPYGRMLCALWLQVMSYPDGKPTVTWIYLPKWMEDRGHLRTPREK